MTDVLRKLSHNGYTSMFQASPSIFQMSPRESVEEILSKVCFSTQSDPVSMPAQLSPFDLKSKFLHPNDSNKKVYFCQRCLNHDHKVPRKNHKSDCPYTNCKCEYCILVENRRKLNSKINDLNSIKMSDSSNDGNDEDLGPYKQDRYQQINGKGERIPNCQKCGQHGKKSRLKGHKRICPFKDCPCEKCRAVTERQKLMADQIKIRRRQKKDQKDQLNLTRDHFASQLQAAAALTATGLTPFSLNAINNALLYQLKTVPHSLLTSPASSDGSSYSPQSSIGSAFSVPTSTPELLKTPTTLLPPSPPSPLQTIVAPVAINPATPNTTSAFNFPLTLGSDTILQLLSSYKLMEPKLEPDAMDIANSIIDVCTV